MAKLIVKRKAEIVKVFELDPMRSQFTLGSSSENDLMLAEKSVSPRHLKLEFSNGNYYLETIPGEPNISFNGRPFLKRVQMVQGDEITIGDLRLLFVSHASGPSTITIGEEIEVIDEHYLDKKIVSNPFVPAAHREAMVNSEPLVKTGIMEPHPETDEKYFDLEEEPEDSATPTPAPEPPAKSLNGKSYHLIAIYGPYLGKKFPLNDGDTRIGRDNNLNDIVIRLNDKGALDPSISRRHATISYKRDRFYISDKRSKTRTYVNQIKLSPNDEIPIDERDEIEIVSDQKSTIFRFSSNAESDLSPPRKAGVWWIRNALRLGSLLSILLAAATIGTLGFSCVNRLSANKKPGDLKFIEEMWFQDSENKRAPGNANMQAQRAGLALGDLNGDGKTDVIFSNSKNNLIALDGVTKKIFWMNEQITVQSAIPIVLVDLNANGWLDVLVVGRDSRLRALDGVNGAEMWLSPILGENLAGAPIAADLNGDGLKDIIVCTEAGQIHFGLAFINEMDWKIADSGMKIRSTPSAADCDGDGRFEGFIGTADGKLLIVNGNGSIARILDLKEEFSKAIGTASNTFEIGFPPAIADLNGNGVFDLLVGSTNGAYLALDGNSFSRIWHDKIETPGYTTAWAAPAAGKFDDDNLDDVALVSHNVVKLIKGSSDPQNRKPGAWELDFDLNSHTAPLAVADFNKDGVHDIIVSLSNGKVVIVNGSDGKTFAEVGHADNPAVSATLVADVGTDGRLDILLIRKDQKIYRIQTNSGIDKNSVVWGQAFGNERNSCRYEFVRPQSRVYDVTLSISSMLFLCAFGTTAIAKKRRASMIKTNQRT